MNLEKSKNSFEMLLRDYRIVEVENIIKICKMLKMPQKILTATLYNFYYGRYVLWFEPDDIVFYSSLIDLSYKMMEVNKSQDQIIHTTSSFFHIDISDNSLIDKYKKAINDLQINFLFETRCDLFPPLLHDLLIEKCMKYKLSRKTKELSWVFLNDLVSFLPSALFFTPEECVYTSIFLAVSINYSEFFDDVSNIRNSYDDLFKSKIDLSDEMMATIIYLSSNLLNRYESGNLK